VRIFFFALLFMIIAAFTGCATPSSDPKRTVAQEAEQVHQVRLAQVFARQQEAIAEALSWEKYLETRYQRVICVKDGTYQETNVDVVYGRRQKREWHVYLYEPASCRLAPTDDPRDLMINVNDSDPANRH
jgi:hypothetical protein